MKGEPATVMFDNLMLELRTTLGVPETKIDRNGREVEAGRSCGGIGQTEQRTAQMTGARG